MRKLVEKHKLEKSDYREWERKLSRETIQSKFKIVKAMDICMIGRNSNLSTPIE